jgi:hypothetical protein
MLKKLALPVCATTFLLFTSANLPAQNTQSNKNAAKNSTEQKEQTKTTTDSGTSKTNSDTVYGKVESYDPGKSMKVTVPGAVMNSRTFDLSGNDITANVPSSIKVGDWVRVREKTDAKGHKTVTVSPSSEKHSGKVKT